MKVHKQLIVPDRVRRPPSDGWSWIDRRFFREYGDRLERDAILLYVFLISVGDKDGLSYYGDNRIADILHMTEVAVVRARDELQFQDLLAYQFPLYQVLALPQPQCRTSASTPTAIGDIMRQVLAQHDDDAMPLRIRRGFTR
jgi:hypothetical protein